MRPEIEISSLYSPCIRFTDDMAFRRNIFSVALPIVGIITGYREYGKFFHQERAAFIRSSSVVPCEYHTGISFNRVPCPSLIFPVPDITPEFIGFGFRPYFNFQTFLGGREVRIHFDGSFFSAPKSQCFSKYRDFSLCL